MIEIEHDEWLYVATDTAEKARVFFGLPADTECRLEFQGGNPVWAVEAPPDCSNTPREYPPGSGEYNDAMYGEY